MKQIFLLLVCISFLESKSQQVSFNEIFELYPHRGDTTYLIKFFKSKAISPWHYEDSSLKAWWRLSPTDNVFSEFIGFNYKQKGVNILDFRTKSVDVYNTWIKEAEAKGFEFHSTEQNEEKSYDLYFMGDYMLVAEKGIRYNLHIMKRP